MKKPCIFVLALLFVLPCCVERKKKTVKPKPVQKQKLAQKEVFTDVNIPTADENIKSFFEEDIGAFALTDDTNQESTASRGDDSLGYSVDMSQLEGQEDDFSWIEESDHNFKAVYFDFNEKGIRTNQEEIVAYNVERAKSIIEQDRNAILIIDGHACHSAGSTVYNLALSEKRAKVLAERLIAAGIPKERIKVVGRGKEIPAIIDGKPVSGDREQQWPNRRDEIRVVYA